MLSEITRGFVRKITTFALVLCLVFSQSAQLVATTASNGAEMAFAVATALAEIAARRCAQTGVSERNVAALSLTAKTLDLATKAFFFKNNIDAYAGASWDLKRRDCYLEGALTLLTLTKWYRDLKVCLYGKQVPVVAEPDDEVLFDDEVASAPAPIVEPPALDEPTLSRLAYAWQVYALPSLKGLTALAVACTQPRATPFSSRHGRFVAMAAHSLVCLLDEQATMVSNSPKKKYLYALLLLNTALLVYELNAHMEFKKATGPVQPPVVVAPVSTENPAECRTCLVALNDQNKVRLDCGHVACRNCYAQWVAARRGEGGLAHVHCPVNEGHTAATQCQHEMNMNDFRRITQDPALLAACQEALAQASHRGFRHCPTPGCPNYFVYSNPDETAPEEHVCEHCNHRYCSDCLLVHPRGGLCGPGETAEQKTVNEQLSLAALRENAQQCSQCKSWINKTEGCNHMTCTVCGHEFCYLCGGAYNHGRHFNQAGPCQNMKFEDRNRWRVRNGIKPAVAASNSTPVVTTVDGTKAAVATVAATGPRVAVNDKAPAIAHGQQAPQNQRSRITFTRVVQGGPRQGRQPVVPATYAQL